MLKRLFISYSRHDSRKVIEIVRLIRVTGVAVFRDYENIAPGKKWKTEILEALDNADTVLVFWSKDAELSSEVTAEYQNAASRGKDIVPILLDNTPLTDILQQFQYVDFTELFMPHSSEGLIIHSSSLKNKLLTRIFHGS